MKPFRPSQDVPLSVMLAALIGFFVLIMLYSHPQTPTTQTTALADNLPPCVAQTTCICSDFVYQQDAMLAIQANYRLGYKLDRDQDGYPCESLPSTGYDDP